MTRLQKIQAGIALSPLCVVLVLFFQNCSAPKASAPSDSQLGGGGTVDGMRFFTYGTCLGTGLDLVNEVDLSADRSSASLVRQNCQTLNESQPVPVTSLQFSQSNPSVFQFSNQVFNQQSPTGGQQVTLQFCQSTNPQVEALIWQFIGDAGSTFGSVTTLAGTGTGSLSVTGQLGASYVTTPGQTSQFTLNLASSSLTYALNGGPPVTVPGLNCSSEVIANFNDGSTAAPAAALAAPGLLGGYSLRAPWKVAGVDYGVGVPTGTVLKDPFPGGVLDANLVAMGGVLNGARTIDFTTLNNVVIDGYDFSLEGGWQLSIGANNVTVQNSNFKAGANQLPFITTTGTPSGLTIQNNTMDGSGLNLTVNMLNLNSDGTTAIELNVIKNAYGGFLTANPGPSGNSVQQIQFNYFQDGGEGIAGPWIGDGNGVSAVWKDIEINFNTFVQNDPNANAMGVAVLGTASNLASALNEGVSNNTIVATNNVGYAIIIDTTWLNGSAVVNDNYFDPTGVKWLSIFIGQYNSSKDGPYNGTATESANYDMVTGIKLP